MAECRIELKGVSYHRVGFSLDPIDFRFEEGTITGIAGKNGSGKSTLLRLIHGDIKAASGIVLLDGKELSNYGIRETSRKMSYLSQEIYEPFSFTVRNIMEVAGYSRGQDPESCLSSLDALGISWLIDKEFTKLSGGERRLVTIAASIYQDSEVMLMDEPTTFLDIDNQALIHDVLRKQKELGKTIILVMHELNAINSICDNVIMLRHGSVIASGPTDAVMNSDNLEKAYNLPFNEVEMDSGKLFIHRL